MLYENAEPLKEADNIYSHLNLRDPVDISIAEFRDAIENDQYVSGAEQRQLVTAMRQGHREAALKFAVAHKGLVAAVVYPFKNGEATSRDLLIRGSEAAIDAALTYSGGEGVDFDSFLVNSIRTALGKSETDNPYLTFVYGKTPMERVVHFVMGMSGIMQEAKKSEGFRRLTGKEKQVVSLLNLPAEEIQERTGMSLLRVYRHTSNARAKMGVETTMALAYEAYSRGIEFELVEAPDLSDLTVTERLVALNSDLSNPEICEKLGLSRRNLTTINRKLYSKTGARTRTELYLMAIKYGFEPTEDEINYSKDPISSLSPDQRNMLPLIHLSEKEIRHITGLDNISIRNLIHRIKTKLGGETREDLALIAYSKGVEFDLMEPGDISALNVLEKQVLSNIHKPNQQIANELKISRKSVSRTIMSVRGKINSRSRTELALIAHIHNIKPTKEELTDDRPEGLKEFNELQMEILPYIYLTDEEIEEKLDIPLNDIKREIKKARLTTGSKTRTALAMDLYKRGMDFDVPRPARPFSEISTQEELDIISMLNLKNQQIADKLGKAQVHSLIEMAKLKTGARNRVELALMGLMYDTGKARQVYHNFRPREDRFFEAIGAEKVPMDEARQYLQYLTPRQAEYIEAYYFSEEVISSRALSARFNTSGQTFIQTVNNGLSRIRRNLHGEGKAAA